MALEQSMSSKKTSQPTHTEPKDWTNDRKVLRPNTLYNEQSGWISWLTRILTYSLRTMRINYTSGVIICCFIQHQKATTSTTTTTTQKAFTGNIYTVSALGTDIRNLNKTTEIVN